MSGEQSIEESTSAVIDVYIHPLVLINISDHYTRTKMQQTKTSTSSIPRVMGCLYGTQEGKRVEIRTSFELIYEIKENLVHLDHEYINDRKKQFAQVFPKYELLGWYSNGEGVQNGDDFIQEQILQYNESPLYLVVGTKLGTDTKELPMYVYESTTHVTNNKPTIHWSKLNYKIETEEGERISIDHVNRLEDRSSSSSSMVPHLNSLSNAVQMLNIRVKKIVQYLELVKAGKVEVDYKVLRQISSLASKLPSIDNPKFSQDYQNEMNETLLITYLTTITKGTNQFNELVDKYNLAYEKNRRSRGGAIF